MESTLEPVIGAVFPVFGLRYKVLEEETSTGAVLSTAVSIVTVSLVMAVMAGR